MPVLEAQPPNALHSAAIPILRMEVPLARLHPTATADRKQYCTRESAPEGMGF